MTPVGVPENYRELLDTYQPILMEVSNRIGVPCSEIIDRLRETRLIEDFDLEGNIPTTFSWSEAIAFLGVSDARWRQLLSRSYRDLRGGKRRNFPWMPIHPNAVNGGGGPAKPDDRGVYYWGPDIYAIYRSLIEHCPGLERPVCARLARAFRRRLKRHLSEIEALVSKSRSEPPETPSSEEWPKGLPRNNEELTRMYGPAVFDHIRRISKIKTDEELAEVNQEIWLSLLKSNVLGHFVRTSRTKLPRTLTLEEALAYLGIRYEQWESAFAKHKRNPSLWMPLPVSGDPLDRVSLYLTADIKTLDTSGFLDGRRTLPRRRPQLSSRGFKSYLLRAVHNHFYNLCRTRRRRHKERSVEEHVVMAPSSFVANGTLSYQKVTTSREDPISWEDTLTDSLSDLPMEDFIDLTSKLRRFRIDPSTDEGCKVLDQILRTKDIREGIKAQERAEIRQRQKNKSQERSRATASL